MNVFRGLISMPNMSEISMDGFFPSFFSLFTLTWRNIPHEQERQAIEFVEVEKLLQIYGKDS